MTVLLTGECHHVMSAYQEGAQRFHVRLHPAQAAAIVGHGSMNWTAVYPASVVFGKKRDDRCAMADFLIQ